jgi:hypothetical protein
MTDKPTPKGRGPRVKAERAVSAAEQASIEQYIETSVPEKHKLATRRALFGQMGKALALKQKCLQCCGYQREEVKMCTVLTCALHPVRPYQDRAPGEPEDEEGDDEN